jgi:hypothetical protein
VTEKIKERCKQMRQENYKDTFVNLVATQSLYGIHGCNDTALSYHLSFKASQFGAIREPSELVVPGGPDRQLAPLATVTSIPAGRKGAAASVTTPHQATG